MLFVVVERRAADPLLDLSLFRKPAFTGVTITGFALSASIFSMVHERARAVASGGTGHALQAVPPADRDAVVHAAHHAFVTGFNTIAMVSVVVAAVGTLAGYALVRSRDFVGAAGPASAPPEPEPAPARA